MMTVAVDDSSLQLDLQPMWTVFIPG